MVHALPNASRVNYAGDRAVRFTWTTTLLLNCIPVGGSRHRPYACIGRGVGVGVGVRDIRKVSPCAPELHRLCWNGTCADQSHDFCSRLRPCLGHGLRNCVHSLAGRSRACLHGRERRGDAFNTTAHEHTVSIRAKTRQVVCAASGLETLVNGKIHGALLHKAIQNTDRDRGRAAAPLCINNAKHTVRESRHKRQVGPTRLAAVLGTERLLVFAGPGFVKRGS